MRVPYCSHVLLMIALVLSAGAVRAAPGPGIPQVGFRDDQLYKPIARFRTSDIGGEVDIAELHNGYLFIQGYNPGKLSWWDLSDVFNPRMVSSISDDRLFKTHSLGVAGDLETLRRVDGLGIYDISDEQQPRLVGRVRPPLSNGVFQFLAWPYFYKPGTGYGTADGNLEIYNVSDPRNPRRIRTLNMPNLVGFRVGSVHVMGNLMIASATETNGHVTLDLGDPENPVILDTIRAPNEKVYTSFFNGNRLYSGGEGAAGLSVYDVSDPRNIVRLRRVPNPAGGRIRYFNVQNGFLHVTNTRRRYLKYNTNTFEIVANEQPFTTNLADVAIPVGNMIFMGHIHANAQVSAVLFPHQTQPDRQGPRVNAVAPRDGEVRVARTSLIGISLDEDMDGRSINASTFTVRPVGGRAVPGRYSKQMGIINFAPAQPLQADTTYEIVVSAGGIQDPSGNGLATTFRSRFSTGARIAGGGGPPAPARPAAPNAVSARAADSTRIDLTWTDNADNETGYRIERRTNGNFAEVARVGTDVTRYRDTGLLPSTTYTYRLRAFNDNATSAYSENVSATTPSTSPPPNPGPTPGPRPRSHWPLDNDVNDVNGGTQAHLANGAAFATDRQVGSHSVQLDGTDDYIDIGPTALGDRFSISLWVNIPSGTSNIQTLAANSTGGSRRDGFRFFINGFNTTDGKIIFGTGDGNAANAALSAPGVFEFDRWNHIAAVVDRAAGTARLYYNGRDVTVDETISTAFVNNTALNFGRMHGAQWQLRGNLDDIRIYNDVINAGQVRDLASAGSGGNTPPPAPNPPPPNTPRGPFGATPAAIPGRIQAEDYDLGGAGQAYHDSSSGNIKGGYRNDDVDVETSSDAGGGFNVAAVVRGEWLEYTVDVAEAGTYVVDLRVARAPSGNSALRVLFDGQDKTGAVAVPSTGGWQRWQTVSAVAELTAGRQIMRLEMLGSLYNLNWIELRKPEPLTVRVATRAPAETDTALDLDIDNVRGGAGGLMYSWDFGDGSANTPFSATSSVTHTYRRAGHYNVVVRVRDGSGQVRRDGYLQIIHNPLAAGRSTHSSSILVDRSGARVWNVNPDNHSVTAVNTTDLTKLLEQPVGTHPTTLAQAPDGTIWVVNRDSASISILDSEQGTVQGHIALPRASRPYGIVLSLDGSEAFVTLQSTGQLLRLDTTQRIVTGTLDVGPEPRGIAISADSARVYIARFVSPTDHAEVYEVDANRFVLTKVHNVARDPGPDTPTSGRGVPNYLGAPALSPDGRRLWLPAKKDNTERGQARDGEVLTFENTVRTMVAKLDTGSGEVIAERLDIDNGNLASAVVFSPLGNIAFVSLLGNDRVEVIDTAAGATLQPLETEAAPQGLALDSSGERLYVHNYLGRSISVFDIRGIVAASDFTPSLLAHIPTVAQEKLPNEELLGKRIFYNSEDTRMSRDGYLSCASCHLDGGSDARVWDFTDRGEGLRNTIDLRGRGGVAQGRVHWSANFDEIQDFEHDIRNHFGGSGFMTDAAFNRGTRNQPLGDPKAGASRELDALAAYVASLRHVVPSPHRNGDGALSASARQGQRIFQQLNCKQCHGGTQMSDSSTGVLHDVGTLKPESGQRLGAALVGLDTPGLRGIWRTPPYLHDGSAATLMDVLTTANPRDQHGATSSLTESQRLQLVDYLLQLDDTGRDVGTLISAHGASASSTHDSALDPQAAIDGRADTRWSSAYDDAQWLQVDLGEVRQIIRVAVAWEAAFAAEYKIQISTDGLAWTDAAHVTTGTGGTEELQVEGNARYVRMLGIRRGTPWGYSLWEFRVYSP